MAFTHNLQNLATQKITLLKPLSAAVSSCLLFACAGTGNYSTTTSQTSNPTITQSTINVNTTTITPIIEDDSQYSQDIYAGVLDQATLDELEDLLQATDMTMVEGDVLTVQRYGNLWDRVRRGYRMQQTQNKRIEAQKSWFYSRQDYLNRLTARTSRYLHHTVTEAERRGIPTELALLPIIESSYDPSATSNAAAAGLWQFIPSTGRIYGLNQSASYDGRRDIVESTRAAYDFLTSLYNQFGSWELALAAYNAGPGRIQRAINANRAAGLPTDYWSLRLPTETMNYVPRFMAVAQIVGAPEAYGVYLPAIANHVHFRAVPTNYGVSLYEVANITGVPFDELRLLNPALINFSVDKLGPGRVIIPNNLSKTIDKKITALRGQGYGASDYAVSSSYVLPKFGVQNMESAKTLASTNTLPTTSAQITPNNTIIQEPPLSQEEREFIKAQIKANTVENIQPISSDGNIELTAVQTGQSVLEARGEVKSLSFSGPSMTPSVPPTTTMPPVSKPNTNTATKPNTKARTPTPKPTPTPATVERYKVVQGDTLTAIAAKHGLSVTQLASYNGITVDTPIKGGQRLWLVPGKVSTVAHTATQTTSASAKTATYTVQAGDSLTSVARKYQTSVSDLAALNGLSVNDGLITNQKLKVPANVTPVKTTTPSKPNQNQPVKYTIQSGDSLTSVANKYGISIDELAAANNLSTDAGLIRGKTLTIPEAGSTKAKAVQPTANKAAKPTQHPNSQATTQTKKFKATENYTVQAGDSLHGLANKYGVSVSDLAAANGLSSNTQLKRGQTIKVPKLTDSYTVKSGDSLNSLAKKYGISVAELAKMNGLDSQAQLKKGQKLTVPYK